MVLMAVLALVGITGMYLSQIRRNGVLGLIGYVLLAVAYLFIMCGVYAAAWMLPEIATANPGYVNDLIAVDTGRGTVDGDIGALQTVIQLRGYAYLAGGNLLA
jgi:TM2 domain-containing membrane protein YozV